MSDWRTRHLMSEYEYPDLTPQQIAESALRSYWGYLISENLLTINPVNGDVLYCFMGLHHSVETLRDALGSPTSLKLGEALKACLKAMLWNRENVKISATTGQVRGGAKKDRSIVLALQNALKTLETST